MADEKMKVCWKETEFGHGIIKWYHATPSEPSKKIHGIPTGQWKSKYRSMGDAMIWWYPFLTFGWRIRILSAAANLEFKMNINM